MHTALVRPPWGARVPSGYRRLPVAAVLRPPTCWQAIGDGRSPSRLGRASSALAFLLCLLCLPLTLTAEASGPFPDRVAEFVVGDGGGFKADQLPDVVMGGPRGGGLIRGSTDVVSLGLGGIITLEFETTVILDGPGPDFTVFENPFLTTAGSAGGTVTGVPFAEPGRVFVSADGADFVAFPCAINDEESLFTGCAGVFPVLADARDPSTPPATVPTTVPLESLIGIPYPPAAPAGSGGDSFDLADVGLSAARFVRIESSSTATFPAAGATAGFDLDAVVAINWSPAADRDGDSVDDNLDNCPLVPNNTQLDADEDGVGDACDLCAGTADSTNMDTDGDGVGDACDSCPRVPDSGDLGAGDACAATEDADADGTPDDHDNCATAFNPGQDDKDRDGVGDACDPCPRDGSCGPLVTPAYTGGKHKTAQEAFLTFARPTRRVTAIPSTDSSVEVLLNVGATVDTDTLRIKARGTDVTDRYSPFVPGTSRRLIIPLRRRRTRVTFRARGSLANGRRRRDVDRLVFRRR